VRKTEFTNLAETRSDVWMGVYWNDSVLQLLRCFSPFFVSLLSCSLYQPYKNRKNVQHPTIVSSEDSTFFTKILTPLMLGSGSHPTDDLNVNLMKQKDQIRVILAVFLPLTSSLVRRRHGSWRFDGNRNSMQESFLMHNPGR